MASTSSSSSSASTHYEYDVFLSFRGEDTRNSFTDHLYQALRRAGIKTFRDDNEIREGQELKPEIERSITRSKASIIVFSKDFAGSRWCLDELWLILEQKRKVNHFVLPVFCGVDPSDVRNQRGSFRIETKEGSKWTEDNVKRWKAALTELADLKGIVVSGYESTFIHNIVKMINDELGLTKRSTPMTGLIGIETRAEGICSWLRNEQPDSPVLAICGMGGSGKTTLAKHIYYSNKQYFDNSSLLVDVEKHRDGLLGVQSQLLRDISGDSNMIISDVDEGALQLERAIHMNKVLIVVDDVDDKDTLSTLFGPKAFPTYSKIIITTRHLDIDKWFGSISCGCLVHKMELLNEDESLGLLSYHAFGSQIPIEGFEELAIKRAQYCRGHPLALKVLGSSLPVSAQDQRARNSMIEAWRSEINSLNSFKGDLHGKIQVVLQRSYESLPYAYQKGLFLHIACFFYHARRYYVEEALENDYHAKSGIMVLVNRCLLNDPKDSNGRLVMHNLLKDMAMKIVDEASKDPAERRIVWRHDEANRLLSNGDGSKTIEGLHMNGRTLLRALKTSSLVKLKNLKYLTLRYVKLTGSYKNFPDLRWLTWTGCCLKTIPPGPLTSSLVVLKPGVDEVAVWLSDWPIGDMLDAGDKVHVSIFVVENSFIVRGCGASVVYMNEGEVECERMNGELEVIGGDLSLFQVTKQGYYLCRSNYFGSQIPVMLKYLFGEDIEDIGSLGQDSRRWRKSRPSAAMSEWNAKRNYEQQKYEVTLGVSFNGESETDKIEKAVYDLVGVESVSIHKERRTLIVTGRVDFQAVVMCVRRFEEMVQVLDFKVRPRLISKSQSVVSDRVRTFKISDWVRSKLRHGSVARTGSDACQMQIKHPDH